MRRWEGQGNLCKCKMGIILKKSLNSQANNGTVGKKRAKWGRAGKSGTFQKGWFILAFSPPPHLPSGMWESLGVLGSDLENKDVWGAGNATLQVFPLSTGLKMFCPCLGFATKTKAQSSNQRFSSGNFGSEGIL